MGIFSGTRPLLRQSGLLRQWSPKCQPNLLPDLVTRRYLGHPRFFSLTTSVPAKVFLDSENVFAHGVLTSGQAYNTFRLPDHTVALQAISSNPATATIFESMDNDSLIGIFERTGNYCKANNVCISHEDFDQLVDALTVKCSDFSDDQLVKVLKLLNHFPATASTTTRNYMELWNALDDAFVDRIKQWKTSELLYICDIWFALNLSKVSKFTWEATKILGRKLRKLKTTEIVQTLFYVNMCRRPIVEMFEVENHFVQCSDTLSLDELSIVAMGFFKTKTRIRNELLITKIYDRLLAETTTVKDITLATLIKILRYSSQLCHADKMYRLLDKLTVEIPRISLLGCLHVALLGTDIQQANQNCLEAIIDRFIGSIKEIRLKDMERIALVIGLLSFHSESGKELILLNKVLDELSLRESEIVKYPRSFAACLHYLSIFDVHSNELISATMTPTFLKHAYGSNVYAGREIFCLDAYARINLKDTYDGNLLTDKKRQSYAKILTNYIPTRNSKYRLSATDTILLEVSETCQDAFNHCRLAHVLPHYQRPDVVVAYNTEHKQAMLIDTAYPPDYTSVILSKEYLLRDVADQQNVQLLTFVIGGWNNFVRDNQRPTGLLFLKLKQLKLLDHNPVLIPWFEWRQLQLKDRVPYIKRLVEKTLTFQA